MKKDTIVQFVCFATNLKPEDFIPIWERYAKKLTGKPEPNVLERMIEVKNKFRYVSQHIWPNPELQFSFMNEKKSEHFPDQSVKVLQAGGYILLPSAKTFKEQEGDIKILSFVSHDEYDIDFYRELTSYRGLNVYQAYYESCTYGYVFEFFAREKEVDELLLQLKQRTGLETGVFKECMAALA